MNIEKLVKQISYSKLQVFNQCPFKFKMCYRYFYRPKGVNSIYGTLGSAIHLAINKKFKNNYDHKELRDVWEETFLEQLKNDEVSLDERGIDNFTKLGYPLLDNFYNYFKDHKLFYCKKVYSELSFYLQFHKEGFYVNGKIDTILEFDDYYQIIDYKTSKSSDYVDAEQLCYYVIGFYDYLVKNHLPIKKIVCGFLYLRQNKYIPIKITSKMIKRLMNKIISTRELIKNDNFIPKQNKFCNWCEFKKIYCPLYNKQLKVKTEFKKKLKKYQLADVAYMVNNIETLNACSMGTGKTISCLYMGKLLNEQKVVNSILVVTPNSIKYQWEKEVQECIGTDYSNYMVINSDKKRYNQYKMMNNKLWVIINYELLNKDIAYFKKHWDMIILDEATRIKNSKVQVSKNIKSLNGTYKIALTGTPIENKVEELFSIFRFVSRHLLGSWEYFDQKYIKRGFFNEIKGYHNLDQLRERIGKYYIRHTMQEVLNDLPKLIKKDRYIELKGEQIKLYNNTVNNVTNIIKDQKNLDETISNNVLAKVIYLREVCDSAELVDESKKDSAKIEEIKQILKDIDLKKDKVVIFSQFVKMINIIEMSLKKEFKNIRCAKITGEVDSKQRQKVMNDLNDGTIDVLLMSDCGAYGINAQVANYLIHVDVPWNPAVIQQRIGRVYRMGQKKVTIIFNLIIKNSIEERVMQVLNIKQDLFNSIFNGSDISEVKVKSSKQITYKELKDML